jgi:hypothetical protein
MQSSKDHLTIRIGKWFEATANGPYAITALTSRRRRLLTLACVIEGDDGLSEPLLDPS